MVIDTQLALAGSVSQHVLRSTPIFPAFACGEAPDPMATWGEQEADESDIELYVNVGADSSHR